MRILKKTVVIVITMALLLAAIPTAFADGSDDDFDWREISEGFVAVKLYTGPGGAVVIPETLSGRTVVQIDADAFKNNKTTLVSVSIPATVETISPNAFNGCTALNTVTFSTGTNISAIPEGAFTNTGLKSIKIPASVITIGNNAFKDCASLTSITFETGKLETIGEGAFMGTKLTSLRVPASVKTISKDAFKDVASLTSITFASGSNLETIGESAFSGTLKGTDNNYIVSIPESVASIETNAFSDCPNLWRVIIPGDAIEFGDDAFVFTIKLDGGGIWCPNPSTARTFAGEQGIAPHDINYLIGDTTITSYTSTGADRVTLVWSTAERAEAYELWRAISSSGAYTKLTLTDPTKTSFTDTNLSTANTYYYKVRGYNELGGETAYGNYSNVVTVKTVLGAPQSLYAYSEAYNSITLKWTPVTGMTHYQIYRSYTYDGSYSLVKTYTVPAVSATAVTPISYKFTGLTTGRTYYYKVRGVKKTMSGKTVISTEYGAYSAVVSSVPVLSEIKNFKAEVKSPTSIKLTWSSVSGRTKYEVWRLAPGDTWKLYGTTSYNYYTNDRNIVTNKEYSYKVRAYRTCSKTYSPDGRLYDAFSNIETKTPTVLKVGTLTASKYSTGKIKLTWSSLTGVSGYELCWASSADAPDAEWHTIYTGTRRYYYHSVTSATIYYYRVRAYKNSTTTIYGPWSDVKNATA